MNTHQTKRNLYFSLIILVTLIFSPILSRVTAHPYPPNWQGGAGPAVHFPPVAWPENTNWLAYTSQSADIDDPRTQDPTNGGTSPQNYVNISSSCIDKTLPSVYWQYDDAGNTLFFRWRVEQIANNYATGPNAGTYSSTSPWNSALWTVLIDTNGDGFRDFAVHLNGSSGSPSTPIDNLVSIYGTTPSQSIDYQNDPNIHLLAHNPTAFADAATSKLLNFQNSLSPTPNWPNGSNETVWDYGTTRASQLVKTSSCSEYYIDYQIPLGLLDATAVGGPKITASTPISLLFTTSNSLNNPLQKDVVTNGDYIADPNRPAPFGDNITPDGGTVAQPIVNEVSAAGCGPVTLRAQVDDAITWINGTPRTSVSSVDFMYYRDLNANGIADDGSEVWSFATAGGTINNPVGEWTASWNSTSLPRGSYLIGVKATDAQGNVTWSYLTQAQVTAEKGTTPPHFANLSPTPGLVTGRFVNTCGTPPPSLGKVATPNQIVAGATTQFTLTVNNPTSSPLTVTRITDPLPPGFSYVSTDGGSLGNPSATPAVGATGTVEWTFPAGTSIPAGSSRTLLFTVRAGSVLGTYTNTATITTSAGNLASEPAQIGVGAPRLSLAKAANVASANPGQSIVYTLTYSNDSPVNVTNAIITDQLPVGLTFVSTTNDGIYNTTTRTLSWNVGNIASGDGPYTVSFSASVDNPYTSPAANLINTATITSDQTTPASASSSTYINAPRPALTIQKDANLTQVGPGGQAVFTINYANTGNATATGVIVTDAIPAGFSFVSASNGGSASGSTVSWSLTPLAAGASGSVQVTLQAVSPFTAANPATNTASIQSSQTLPVSDSFVVGVTQSTSCSTFYFRSASAGIAGDSAARTANTTAPTGATTSTLPNPVATVGATRVELARFYQSPAQASDVVLNGPISYTLFVNKTGSPRADFAVTLYSYNPATGVRTELGVAPVTTGVTGNRTNEPVTASWTPNAASPPTIRQGHQLLWVVSATTDHASQTNDLSVNFDSTTSNSRAEGVCLAPPAKLVLDKQVNSLLVQPGGTLQYTIKFANIGQTDATNAQITDSLPGGTSFVSATLNGLTANPTNIAGQQYTFAVQSTGATTAGQVARGQSGTLIINVAVAQPMAQSIASLVNTAALQSTQTTPITDTAITTVVRPNVTITKAANKSLLIPGDIVTFTLTALNSGIGTATNVIVRDVLPVSPYLTYVPGSTQLNGAAVSPEPVSSGTLNLQLASLAPGASAVVTMQMRVATDGVPSGVTTVANTATVSDAQTVGSRTSNEVLLSISTNPNLRLAKTVNPATGPVPAGTRLTYTLTLSNIGSGEAQNVLAQDAIPTNTTYVPNSLRYEAVAQTDALDGDIAHFDAANNRVSIRAGLLAGGGTRTVQFDVLVNAQLANGTTPIDNTATVSATNAASKLGAASISATAAPELSITKTAPTVLAFPLTTVAASATASTTIGVVNAAFINVNDVVMINGTLTTIVAKDGNQLTLSTPVTTANGTPVYPTYEYVLRYTNTGTAVATAVMVQDVLPAGLAFVSADSGGIATGNTVSWEIGNVAPDTSSLLRVRVRPTSAGVYRNTASIDSAETPNVLSNQTTTSVGGLELSKSTMTPLVTNTATGTQATYVLTLVNQLPVEARGVVVTDQLSSGFSFASTSGFGGNAVRTAVSDPQVGDNFATWGTWNIPGNGSLTITFVAAIDASVGGATYQNEFIVASSNTAVLPFDALSTTAEDVTVTINTPPVLQASKTVERDRDANEDQRTNPGDDLSYTITISNTSSQAATGVVFNDILDSNTTLIVRSVTTTQGSITTGNTDGDTSVSVNVGSLAGGSSVTISFRVTINNPLPDGVTYLSNQGTVSSNELPVLSTDDPGLPGTTDPTITYLEFGPLDPMPMLLADKQDALVIDADGNTFPSPGDTLEYTIDIYNIGDGEATNVNFSDTPDGNTSLVVGSVQTNVGTITSGNTTGETVIGVAIDSIEGGMGATISFRVVINAPLALGVTQIANQGSIASDQLPEILTDDPETVEYGDPTLTPVTAAPILTASKVDSLLIDPDGNTMPSPGDTIVYQVTVTNSGNQDATGVVFSDTPDNNTTLDPNSLQTSRGTISLNNGTIEANIGTLAAGEHVDITFHVTINSPLVTGITTISNQGVVNSTNLPAVLTDDPDVAGASDPTITPVTADPRLAATKTVTLAIDADSNGIASPGDTLLYQVTIANNGNATATSIRFTDLPDSNTSLLVGSVQSSPGTVITGNTPGDTSLSVNIGALPGGGASAIISFRVTINTPLPTGVVQVVNQGSVSSDQLPTVLTDDPALAGASDPTATPVTAAPVLQAAKTATLVIDADNDGNASPGDTLLYSIVVANNGNTSASNVIFSDTPDSNTALISGSVQTSQGQVVVGNNPGDSSIQTDLGVIPASANVSITFRVVIDAQLPAGVTQVANQGIVSSNELPALQTDNPGTEPVGDPTITPVTTAPILDASKSDSLVIDADGNTYPSPGDTLEYTVNIQNTGNGVATGVVFSDTPDANTTLVIGSVQTNAGTITSGNTPGNAIVAVNVGDVVSGSTATISFRVVINTPLPGGVTEIINQGRVASDQLPVVLTDDPGTEPVGDSTRTPVTAAPILSSTKTYMLDGDMNEDGFASPGDSLLYQITIANTGNTSADNVMFSDTPDSNTILEVGSVQTSAGTIASGNQDGDTTVDVNIGTIPAGASVTITFTVTINVSLPAEVTQIVNQGTVSIPDVLLVPTDDPDVDGPTNPTITPLSTDPMVVATKSDALAVDVAGDGAASPGDTLLYQVTIGNNGNGAATGISFSDILDGNTALVVGSVQTSAGAVTSGNATGDTTVAVAVDELPAFGELTISFQAIINNPLPAGVTQVANQGVVSSNELADIVTDDIDTVEADDPTVTPVEALPDMQLTITDGGITGAPGGTIGYALTYTNAGSQTATGVALQEVIPAHTTFNAGASTAGWTCTPNTSAGSVCTLAIGTVTGNGGTGSATFAVTVAPSLPAGVTAINNTATVADDGANGADPTPANNTASDTTPVSAAPDLVVTKTDGVTTALPGDELTYSIAVTNAGTKGATGVSLSDMLPASTQFVSATDGGLYDSTNNVVRWPLFDLAANAGTTRTVVLRINASLPAGVETIINTAVATDDGTNGADPTPNNNTGSDTNTVTASPDLQLTLSDGGTMASSGSVVVYTLDYSNVGLQGATGSIITQIVPANSTFNAGASTPGWSCADGAAAGTTCQLNLGSIAAGASGSVQFAVAVVSSLPPNVAEIVDSATIGDDGLNGADPTPANNVASDTTPMTPTSITLLSFNAVRKGDQVEVRWSTGAEINTSGFYLYRSTDRVRTNAVRITPQLIPGEGRGQGYEYLYVDTTAAAGVNYSYWLQEVEIGEQMTEYGPATTNSRHRMMLPFIGR